MTAMELLMATLASFVPAKYRTWGESLEKSTIVRGSVISGVLEFVLFGDLAFLQFRKHFLALADHFAQGNVGTQTAALLVVAASEVFYPLSFVLIFLAVEGVLRALSGAIIGEPLPSLPVALAARFWAWAHRPHRSVVAR
jgi:hypothetical protein